MTFLVILLLIIGVIVVMAAALVGLSFGAGVHFNKQECPRASRGADPCAQCDADRDWYHALPLWKQNLTAAWWWANRVACANKGCR